MHAPRCLHPAARPEQTAARALHKQHWARILRVHNAYGCSCCTIAAPAAATSTKPSHADQEPLRTTAHLQLRDKSATGKHNTRQYNRNSVRAAADHTASIMQAVQQLLQVHLQAQCIHKNPACNITLHALQPSLTSSCRNPQR